MSELPTASDQAPKSRHRGLLPHRLVKGSQRARDLARRGRQVQLENQRRREALAAHAWNLGASDLHHLYLGTLNATLEALCSRLRSEVNRSPLRPDHLAKLLELSSAAARLLGIQPGRPGSTPPAGRTEQAPPAALAPRLVAEPGPSSPTAAASSAGPAADPTPPARLDEERASAPID